MGLSISGWKKIAIIFFVLSGISACSSDSSDEIIDSSKKDRQATISFANGLNESADFYVKARVLNRDVFDSQQRATTVLPGNVSNYVLNFNRATEDNRFGVRDADTQVKSSTLAMTVNHQATYWVVAWLNDTVYQLAGFRKRTVDEAGVFKIRVFSNTTLEVKINGSNSVVALAEKGKVTAHFSLTDCAVGLNVGGNFIDFCNEAIFGRSYLAVVDGGGKIVVAQE